MINLLDKIPVSPVLQKLIGALAIILISITAVYITRFFLHVIVRKITARTKTDLDDELLRGTHKKVYLLIYLFGLSVLFNYIEAIFDKQAGEMIFRYIDKAIYSVGVFLVAAIIVKVFSTIYLWYAQAVADKSDTKVDDEFIPLVDRATKVIIYILAVLVVLDHLDIDIKGLITVLGVGSLAVALAAQETIANMIGGFVIMIDRPFRTGDWVRLSDGTICCVYQIGVRSSKFLTLENSLIIVPNSELVKSTIHNITYPYPELRIRIDVGVAYESDMAQVKRVMTEEALSHPDVAKETEPFFRFFEFGDSSLNVTLFCRVSEVADQFRIASDIREQILNRFRKEGIEIPFPQRVVTIVNNEEKKS